jgi:predicted HAD superfamily Cof-like phosphohydrolase
VTTDVNIAMDPDNPAYMAQAKLATAYSADVMPILEALGLKDKHVTKAVLTIDCEHIMQLEVTRYVTEGELAALKDHLIKHPQFRRNNMSRFSNDIVKFNDMYGMPVSEVPTLINAQRLRDFKSILTKELNEIDAIILALEAHASSTASQEDLDAAASVIQVDLADLFGDLQVYCASEMVKWGVPIDETLQLIMASNFSKMGADGKPIFDEQGKLQKGENYWKPEPRIAMLLEAVEIGGRIESLAEQFEALSDQVFKGIEDD